MWRNQEHKPHLSAGGYHSTRRLKFVLVMAAFLMLVGMSVLFAAEPLEPRLSIAKGEGQPQVALTLDLCMGKTDHRIFDLLIKERIPATLFVTGRWLARNRETIDRIRAHPELFEIGNHGENHIPAIDTQKTIYGLKTAGSLSRICQEIEGGAKAIVAHGLEPQFAPFYRDASARYSVEAIKLIDQLGYQVAGFSLNADMGASLSAKTVERRIAAAKNGDVVIAHMNQPQRLSGAGVAEGIVALKSKGMQFVKLSEGLGSGKAGNATRYISCSEIFKAGDKKQ